MSCIVSYSYNYVGNTKQLESFLQLMTLGKEGLAIDQLSMVLLHSNSLCKAYIEYHPRKIL